MDCPVCDRALIVVEREKVEIDFCLFCKGLWFDAGEIEALQINLGLGSPFMHSQSFEKRKTSEKRRPCPRCRKKMDKVAMGKELRVLIDRCPAGEGFWFDQGELGALLGERADLLPGSEGPIFRFLGETVRIDHKSQKEAL